MEVSDFLTLSQRILNPREADPTNTISFSFLVITARRAINCLKGIDWLQSLISWDDHSRTLIHHTHNQQSHKAAFFLFH
jgi:hypothetical protein